MDVCRKFTCKRMGKGLSYYVHGITNEKWIAITQKGNHELKYYLDNLDKTILNLENDVLTIYFLTYSDGTGVLGDVEDAKSDSPSDKAVYSKSFAPCLSAISRQCDLLLGTTDIILL
uniref:Uncharacterized protein n=1 Tax=Romanomermis culicivorax TaxID=13658 RepID=A0A915IJD3_ROMCU